MITNKEKYQANVGILVKKLREHHNLDIKDLIQFSSLKLKPLDLQKVEKGKADLSLNNFTRIVNTFNLDQDKVFEHICLNCDNVSLESLEINNFLKDSNNT